MTKSVGEILESLVCNSRSQDLAYAKNKNAVNSYFDSKVKLARQALWELVRRELSEVLYCEDCEALTDTLASLEKLFIEREK